VGVVSSLQSIYVVVLAYYFLGEEMAKFDYLAIVLATVSISLVIFGYDVSRMHEDPSVTSGIVHSSVSLNPS